MSDTALLEAINVTKSFPTGGLLSRKYVHAVEGFSFVMPADQATITTLAGESGSGKTTIANLFLGLLKPTRGEIRYKGQNIHNMSKSEWLTYRKDVQAVFQDPYAVYNPIYRIDRVLNVPINKFELASSKDEAHELSLKAMKAVGLRPEDILGRYPHQLSGGERQRIMLARILCLMPAIIVADEAISMIDVSLRAAFLNILMEFRRKFNISCIFITHNLTNAYYLGGDVMILCRGRVLEKGDMESVVNNPTHPYTKVLITSIPHTNPKDKWKDRLEMSIKNIAETAEAAGRGCIYCDRCPSPTDRCLTERPPMVTVGLNHQVACFSCT